MTESRPQWSSRTKLTVVLLIMALGLFLLYQFRVVIPPLILAIIIAYVLSPVVQFIQDRLGINRGLVVLLVFILLIAVLIALPVSIFPQFANQFAGLNLDYQRVIVAVEDALGHRYVVAGRVIDGDAIFQQVVGLLQGILEPVFGQTLGIAVDVISSLVWVVFITVVSFYLIKDGAELGEWLEQLVPPIYRADYIRLRNEIGQIWSAFFRGQIVLAIVVATIFTISGFVIGLPFALVMGILAGILELIPTIGHAIWLITASVLALFMGSTWMPVPNWVFWLMIIVLHIVFQQFDLNYLLPRIIGRRVLLPPLVVILGIVIGAVIAGVLGIFLAAPTIASARVIGGYVYANLFDLDPFPDIGTEPLPPPDAQWWRRKNPGDGPRSV
jgi:predicted PurR-regulated permease PerM